MHAKKTPVQPMKIVVVIFVITTLIFAGLTYFYYDEGLKKSTTIKALSFDIEGKMKTIENQTGKIKFLNEVNETQTATIINQTGEISQLNTTVFGQKDTIQRQIVELKNRYDAINLLKGNVSLLKGEVEKKEGEIASLTPVNRGYFVAAVKGDGGGAIIPLIVKILPKGSGFLSVNIKNVDLQSGAQESIRLAAAVASKLSSVSILDRDIDVSFVNQFADIVKVDGPSAGGAITATIYSALTEKNINDGTYMTGTIEPDGSIGAVGGVAKKAEAARDQGATRFLVPKGQKVSVTGIEVEEVDTIQSVLNHLIS